METGTAGWTLNQLADMLGGELCGPADLMILRPAPAGSNDAYGLGFAESTAYVERAASTDVAAILIARDAPVIAKPCIRVDSPRASFAQFLQLCSRPLPITSGVHPLACVSPEAEIDPSASIGAYVVIERGAEVGANCRIYPFAYVGEDCRIGQDVTVYPHAVLYQDVVIGAGSVVHAGAVLGADGFGFVWNGSFQQKVPQVGGVMLGHNVEVGALTAIDRATAGQTVVGDGTKFDNLVQVAHNCTIGKHTVVASQTGISGSTVIGNRVTMGGQSATSDHVRVGDDIMLGGRTGVTKDIDKPGPYWGVPAIPFGEALRVNVSQRKLPELLTKVKELEKRIAELEKSK